MARTAFDTAEIAYRFGAYHYTGSDGYPAAYLSDDLHIEAGGKDYLLPNVRWVTDEDCVGRVPVRRFDAEVALAAVKAAGTFDPTLWVEMEPQPTLQERFAEEAEREAMERFERTGRVFA